MSTNAPTSADHLAYLTGQDPTLMRERHRQAWAWALPILRASLATPAEREIMAADIEALADPSGNSGLLQRAAMMIRTTPIQPNQEHRERVARILSLCAGPPGSEAEWAMKEAATLLRMTPNPGMPAEIRHALERLLNDIPTTHGDRDALTWILREKRGSVQPAEIRHQGPTPKDTCPVCNRVIQEIMGEAPTAVREWICADCFDGGIQRKPVNMDPEIREDDASRDILTAMATHLETLAHPLGMTENGRRLMARGIRRFLSTFESLESAPCPSPGCPSNMTQPANNQPFRINSDPHPRDVLRAAAEHESSPTLKAAMLWAATTEEKSKSVAVICVEDGEPATSPTWMPTRIVVQRICKMLNVDPVLIEVTIDHLIQDRKDLRQAVIGMHPWETSDQNLAPKIKRIRQAIEMLADWQEAAGTEAENGPTPAAKERASGQAMILLQVVGLLGLAMGPAEE